MLAKASSFKDLESLDLTKKTIEFLIKRDNRVKFNDETDMVQRLILWGRQILPDINQKTVQYVIEFLKALDEHSLIRHDFSCLSLNIGRFYRDIFFGETTPYLVHRLVDFKANEAYEKYLNTSWGDLVDVSGAIQSIIPDKTTADSIILYYGLEDGLPRTMKEIDESLGFKPGLSYARIHKAIPIIRKNKGRLPELFGIENRVPADMNLIGKPFYEFSYGDPLMYRDKTGRKALELLYTL